MIGRTLKDRIAQISNVSSGEKPILAVEGLKSELKLRGVSFDLYPGEILGVAALQGQGQLELFMSLFGAQRYSEGTFRVRGREVRIRSPHDAIRNGISFVPADHKSEGVMTAMSGLLNVTLPSLSRFQRLGFLNKRMERRAAIEVLQSLNVSLGALDNRVSALSGGNQQKLVIGKWLLAESDISMMYDPTRGVDIGTKVEIYSIMETMTADGRSVLFYSTDIEELVSVANRIIVIYRGMVAAEFVGTERTASRVLAAMLGGTSGSGGATGLPTRNQQAV
jgi:ribose transport system ATP-binding protein